MTHAKKQSYNINELVHARKTLRIKIHKLSVSMLTDFLPVGVDGVYIYLRVFKVV